MAIQVISQSGTQYGMIVNHDGSINVGSIINSNPKSEVYVSGIISDFTTMYKQYMDYQGAYQPVYIGLALPGTGSETAGWMIRKYIYENNLNVAVLFGSGNTTFNAKWSDRSGINEVYS